MINKLCLFVLVGMMGIYATGCSSVGTGGPTLPEGWQQVEASETYLKENKAYPAIRVAIPYAPAMGNHASLWVGTNDDGWLLWDPGSWFTDSPVYKGFKRERDLIHKPTPTLEQYWEWRVQDADGIAMLIFEWDLSEQRANRMYDILMNEIDTDVVPGRCAVEINQFVRRFGPPSAPGPACDWLPACTAEHFWKQNPSRVIVFRENKPTIIMKQR